MLGEIKLPFLLSLVLLFFLWKEAQGRCSSCPNNACPQTGMSQGWAFFKWYNHNSHIFMPAYFRHAYVLTSLLCRKCYRASYHSTSYQSPYYVTTYYRVTSQGSSTYRCGSWFRRRRCTRYHTNYHQRWKCLSIVAKCIRMIPGIAHLVINVAYGIWGSAPDITSFTIQVGYPFLSAYSLVYIQWLYWQPERQQVS